jgi:integrase
LVAESSGQKWVKHFDQEMTMGERVRLTKRLIDSVSPPVKGEIRLWDSEARGFVARVFHNRRVSFGIKLRVGPLQRWITIGDLGSPWTVEQARERARYMLAEALDGIDPQLEKQEARAALTVTALIERYLVEGRMAKPNKRESSWANDASLMRRHAIPLIGKRIARDLKRQDIERLQADVAAGRTAARIKTKARGLARISGGKTSAGGLIRSFSAMMSWALRNGMIDTNPCIGVEKYQPGRRERFLTTEEARMLLKKLVELTENAEIDESHAAIIRLLLFTGARKSEILGLMWNELDLERGRIVLPRGRSKTGEKIIPLNSASLAELVNRPRKTLYVFPSLKGTDGPTVGLYKSWEKVRVSLDLQGVRLHDLRHSFASFAAARGASLYVIGKALGHTQASTTQRYAHLSDDPVRRAAETVADQILGTGLG